jgi:hypothetical protein
MVAPTRFPQFGGAAVCPVCGGSDCVGFPVDGPVLWQKGEEVAGERVYVGKKVRNRAGVLLFGTHDGIPVDQARELAAAGLIEPADAERLGLVESAPASAKATPAKTRARKPSENR